MIRFRQILAGGLLVCVTLLIGGAAAQPNVPPPTRDQEGTEAAWDITHPGWRDWFNDDDEYVETSTGSQTGQAEVQALKRQQALQQRQLEEAQRRQQEEEQRRLQLEQYWQQVQAQQRMQEAQRQKVFEQAKQTLLVNFRMPSMPAVTSSQNVTVPDHTATWPIYGQAAFGQATMTAQASQTGLSPQEWQQARQYQGLIETLRQSANTPPEDRAILDLVEARRNALWAKAVSVPGLPDDARETLALTLPIAQSKGPVPRITRADIDRLETTAKKLKDASEEVAWSLLDNINDQASDNLPESAVIENSVTQFGHLLTVAKITMTAVKNGKDGAASAIAESVDFVIGLLPFPQAQGAVAGGRVYSDVAFQATNQFMTEAMKATGHTFDSDAFWQDFKKDLTVGQHAVMEFIQYGTTN